MTDPAANRDDSLMESNNDIWVAHDDPNVPDQQKLLRMLEALNNTAGSQHNLLHEMADTLLRIERKLDERNAQ